MDTSTLGETLQVAATDTLGRRVAPRRYRPMEEKVRIVEESLQWGASVAEVARRHEVNANLLFSWRRLHQRGLLKSEPQAVATKLLPVRVRSAPKEKAAAASSVIEIELTDQVRVRISGEAAPQLIEAVLAALTRRSG